MVRSCTQLHRYIRSLDKTQNFFEGIRFILDTCGPTDILRSLDGIQNFFNKYYYYCTFLFRYWSIQGMND